MNDAETSVRFCPCGAPTAAPHRGYCRLCHNAYNRAWRIAHHYELSPEQSHKARVRSVSKMALRRGRLTRQPCEVCGERAEMHHPDYSQPLLVRWLCPVHHRDVHDAAYKPPVRKPRQAKPPTELARKTAAAGIMRKFEVFAPKNVPRGTS